VDLKFEVRLRLHASLRETVNNVRNVVNQIGNPSKCVIKNSQNHAKASEQLHAVVEPNDSVVTRISDNPSFIPHVHSSGRDGQTLTQNNLKTQAEPVVEVAFLGAVAAALGASRTEIPLTALVLGTVSLDRQISQVTRTTMW